MVTVGQGQGVILKSSQEIDLMRTAGKILAEVLLRLREEVRPGVTTADLDAVAAKEMKRHHVEPSFLGYHGYPARLCASVNDEIVHGIPGPKVLNEGDIIGLDCGVIYKGFQADSAVTVPVGQITDDTQRLIDVTRTSLEAGIAAARNGARIGDISAAIQAVIEAAEFAIVREYVGHGIGRKLHEEPQVPNFGVAGRGLLLRKGMALALEPMVNTGTWQTRVAPDHWTVLTADGGLSAHFEHTISITDDEPEVMTKL
jgi:methionyl aminopeptidase